MLDLGAGYGVVTHAVLTTFPAAQVTLLDYSAAMLEHARPRLAAPAAQLRWVVADLSAPGWERELEGPYDAVVSAATLHNLRDGPRIRALYGEIARLLAPGGAFLNLDHVTPGGPRIEAQYALIRGGAPSADAASRWQRFPADLPTHLAWLREAGFAEVDCFAKEFQRALYGGYMP